jgi:small GTP-binding protein
MSRTFAPATYKVVIVGCSGVGKSSIIQRLVHGTFTDDVSTTCGADFYTHSCAVSNEHVKLQIWDTAGQERFRAISKAYFRNAVGAVLVYDITRLSSFDGLGDWLGDLHRLAAPNAYILLVGNKADLEQDRQVDGDLVRDFAGKHGLETIETSARNGKNIAEAFARLSFEVSTAVSNGSIAVGSAANRTPQAPAEAPANPGKGCCG